MWHRRPLATTLCFLAICLASLASTRAQDTARGTLAGDKCDLADNDGFERRPISRLQIATKFIAKPELDAGVHQIQSHLIYSYILGTLSSAQLSKSSSNACIFGSSINASLDLRFELFGTASRVHDECSLRRCARSLSGLLKSPRLDQATFAEAIGSIREEFGYWDSADLTRSYVSGWRAAREALRHIYPAGTPERAYLDLSAEDFARISLDEFSSWLKDQQVKSSERERDTGPVQPPTLDRSILAGQSSDAQCVPGSDSSVREVNIDHHGWGQQSIILIKNGFEGDGLVGIKNAALRAICPPGEKDAPVLSGPPWRDMVGRVSCVRQIVSNQDRWLILFSKQGPAQTSAAMRHYAQHMARVLKGNGCSPSEGQIVVANFLRERESSQDSRSP